MGHVQAKLKVFRLIAACSINYVFKRSGAHTKDTITTKLSNNGRITMSNICAKLQACDWNTDFAKVFQTSLSKCHPAGNQVRST